MKKLIIILTAILYAQMCCNPARRTVAEQETDRKDSPSVERMFISDRLQNSLENFLKLVDTSDVFMVCLKPGVYRNSEDTSHRKDVVTISFWVDNKDTNVIFAGRHGISAPINVGTGAWIYNENRSRGQVCQQNHNCRKQQCGYFPGFHFGQCVFAGSVS